MNRPVALAALTGTVVLAACSLLNAPDDVKPGGSTSSTTGSGGMGGMGGMGPVCGNRLVEKGETCDPPDSCPKACPKNDKCGTFKLVGDAKRCTAACEPATIVACSKDKSDGCCAPGCTGKDDVDCAKCGNGIVELGELCDDGAHGAGGGGAGGHGAGGGPTGAGGAGTGGGPGAGGGTGGHGVGGGGGSGPPGACPTQCTSPDPCMVGMLSGSAATCDARCTFQAVVTCVDADGCCAPGCTPDNDEDCVFYQHKSYSAGATFTDAIASTTLQLAFDGTSYWEVNVPCGAGCAPGTINEAQYSADGTKVLGTYSALNAGGGALFDFRSLFTKNGGGPTVYGRPNGSNTIFQQAAPGNLNGPSFTLQGPQIMPDVKVLLTAANEFVALEVEPGMPGAASVDRWDQAGNYLGSVQLAGYGVAVPGENNLGGISFATAGRYFLTYSAAGGVLSAFDHTGKRVNTTVLNGVGTSNDSVVAFSYANKKVWVVDQAMGTWRGYDVGL